RRRAVDVQPRAEGQSRARRRLRRDGRDAGQEAAGHLSEGDPDRPRDERRPERRRHLQADPGRSVRGLLVTRLGRGSRTEEPRMIAVDALKAAVLLFFVAIVQVSLLSSVEVVGGAPNLLLVTIVAVALLRGSVFGAAGG